VGLTTHTWTASMVRASAAVDVFAISAITVRMFVLVVFVCSVIFAMFRLHVVIVIVIIVVIVPTINFQNSQPVP
jgi:hypothetical protein